MDSDWDIISRGILILNIPIKNFISKIFEVGGGAVLLLWAIFSPPLALIAKTETLWALFYFLLIGMSNKSEDYSNWEWSDGEG